MAVYLVRFTRPVLKGEAHVAGVEFKPVYEDVEDIRLVVNATSFAVAIEEIEREFPDANDFEDLTLSVSNTVS
jgi:hypothetical protein